MNKNFVLKKDGWHKNPNSVPNKKGIFTVDITVRCVRSLWNAGVGVANLARRFGKTHEEIRGMLKK